MERYSNCCKTKTFIAPQEASCDFLFLFLIKTVQRWWFRILLRAWSSRGGVVHYEVLSVISGVNLCLQNNGSPHKPNMYPSWQNIGSHLIQKVLDFPWPTILRKLPVPSYAIRFHATHSLQTADKYGFWTCRLQHWNIDFGRGADRESLLQSVRSSRNVK